MKQYKAWELLPEEKVYLKSEADKVIAEKDKEIAELKAMAEEREKEIEFMHSNCKWYAGDGCARLHGELMAAVGDVGELKAEIERYNKQLRHHKYKRCLAMARWCEISARENDTRMCLPDKWKFTRHEEYLYFVGYYHKWHKRWLELAQKFKEAK
jgi:hypothetical protein